MWMLCYNRGTRIFNLVKRKERQQANGTNLFKNQRAVSFLTKLMFKDSGPLGFRIQRSGHGFHWQRDMLCAYLWLSCAYMLYLPDCWGPVMLPFGFGRNFCCWDSMLGSKGLAKGAFPFLGALLHLLFSVLLHALKTCISIQYNLKVWNTGCASSSPSPNVCAFSALKSLPVSRESPLLCPGLSPCLGKTDPHSGCVIVGLLLKMP